MAKMPLVAGLTAKTAHELKSAGVDLLTLGDHVWDQKILIMKLMILISFVVPQIYLNPTGRDRIISTVGESRIAVFTVLGRSFMGPKVACPFKTAEHMLNELTDKADLIVCEIHAETTSEKESIGWFLDGRVHLVLVLTPMCLPLMEEFCPKVRPIRLT